MTNYEKATQLVKQHGADWINHTGDLTNNPKPTGPKVGEIYYTSWGYDQTNYEYITVIEVSATGKTVKCQRTSYKDKGASGCSVIQEPIYEPFGDIFRLCVRKYDYSGDGFNLVGSYPFCESGTGSKRSGYFSKASKGAEFAETAPGWGH